MNDTIRTQLAHSSVRAFTNEPVTAELRTQILDAARAASTSCALQVTSIIRVTDPALRARIAELSSGQAHVAAAPEFWVFCADYHRLQLLCPEADLGWIEQFLVGCLDTGIMAQNAFTALESLGLGGCFIGGIRNGITEVSAPAAERLSRRRHRLRASRRAQSRQAAAARHHHLHEKRLRRTRASRT